MPKKKRQNKNSSNQAISDFTLNDCANALKPVARLKKTVPVETVLSELSWDQIDEDDLDIIEESNADGSKSFILKNKRRNSKTENEVNENHPGKIYPEIVWYLISWYIKPEDIGNFAKINKTTYAITKQVTFWRTLYKRYCQFHPRLPKRLCLENSYRLYGLRQRVIRALYHTYNIFYIRILEKSVDDSRLHLLVKRRCVNAWYCEQSTHWLFYFKLKKTSSFQGVIMSKRMDFLEELGRIDANPDEDTQVLRVSCENFYHIPPLMGMTLSSVRVRLSQGLRHRTLHLGFNTGDHNVCKNILPECMVVLDTVINIHVFDWWHPMYPHFDNQLPSNLLDDESVPVLKKDFFTTCNAM